jgi:hypothetical protein
MRRIAVALCGAVLLAGCGGGPAGSPADRTPTPAPAPTAPAGTPAERPSGRGGGGTPRCHTADLTVTTGTDDAGGAAGSYGEFLVFTNRSRHTCTLYGYPGVSFVAGDRGIQVNVPFTRTEGTKSTVRLAAGGMAHALIVLVRYENYPSDACKPVAIRGYRVYPPDETAAVFVSAPQKACSVRNKGVGQVQPIAAGAGE